MCTTAYILVWTLAMADGDAELPSPLSTPKYNVKTFGAKGDGVTDDTAALLAAAAAANVDPGVVLLPAGTYVLSRPLTITSSNVTLRGEGEDQTRILIRKSLTDVFGGTWAVGSEGSLKSMWGSGGAFIQFSGQEPESSSWTDTKVAAVTGSVTLGSTRLSVAFHTQPAVGHWVRIFVNNASAVASKRRRRSLQQAVVGEQSVLPLWQEERLAGLDSNEERVAVAAEWQQRIAAEQQEAADLAMLRHEAEWEVVAARQGGGQAAWHQPQLEMEAAAADLELPMAQQQGWEHTAAATEPAAEGHGVGLAAAAVLSPVRVALSTQRQPDKAAECAARLRLRLHQLSPGLDATAVEPREVGGQSTSAGHEADAGSRMRRRRSLQQANGATLSIVPVPSRLQSDPVFLAAAHATQLLSGGEHGLSLDQAWGANKAASPSAGSTVEAWDWGSYDGDTPILDELQFTARVTAVSSNWIQLDRPLPFSVLEGQSTWVHYYKPSLSESGVERLTVEFAGHSPSSYAGHGTDRGYNAIGFYAASNVWARQVTIANCENGVFAHWVDHASLLDVTVLSTRQRADASDSAWQRQGHHAFDVAMSHTVLAQRFTIAARYWHDVSLGRGALLNVFNGGGGRDLNVFHQSGSLGNLFSDVDAGYGNRTFTADNGAPSRTGHLATFWNVLATAQGSAPTASPPPFPSPPSPRPPVAPSPRPPPPPSPRPPSPKPPSSSPPPTLKPSVASCFGESNTQLLGGNLALVNASSLADCQLTCRSVGPICGAVTFFSFSNICYLKRVAGWARVSTSGAQSSVLAACQPAPSPPPSITLNPGSPQQCNSVLVDTELSGGNLHAALVGVGSIQACYTACLADGPCAAFTYVAATKTCVLKDIADWFLRMSAGSQSVVVCPEPFPSHNPPFPPARSTRRMLDFAPAAATDGSQRWEHLRQLLAPEEVQVEGEAGKAKTKQTTKPKATAIKPARLRKNLRGQQPRERNARSESLAAAAGGNRHVMAFALAEDVFLPLVTPPCELGSYLNFVGAYRSQDQCLDRQWVIESLDDGDGGLLPADLYAQQRLTRMTSGPLPSGASRPGPAAVSGACSSTVTAAGATQCWILAFDQCLGGYAHGRNHLPRSIVNDEPAVLAALYQATAPSNNFGNPPRPPLQYTRVCLANPSLAGSGACKNVAKGDYLVQVAGIRPASYGQCDFQPGSVYVVMAAVDVLGHLKGFNATSPSYSF